MSYEKAEVAVLQSAINAVRSATYKFWWVVLDTDQSVRPIEPATCAAYEIDE
ncbi:MAG: hypothetical protein L0338_35620 [Acidobacteria bacterium]|nr:hypothetical protein [Acidobacteriota bacterium]